MLRLIEIPLKMPEHTRIHPAMGSIFHGALMNVIAPTSAELYHHMTLRPYSQVVYWDETKHCPLWRIGTLKDWSSLWKKYRPFGSNRNNMKFRWDRCSS